MKSIGLLGLLTITSSIRPWRVSKTALLDRYLWIYYCSSICSILFMCNRWLILLWVYRLISYIIQNLIEIVNKINQNKVASLHCRVHHLFPYYLKKLQCIHSFSISTLSNSLLVIVLIWFLWGFHIVPSNLPWEQRAEYVKCL